jgi:hypothetical protein
MVRCKQAQGHVVKLLSPWLRLRLNKLWCLCVKRWASLILP